MKNINPKIQYDKKLKNVTLVFLVKKSQGKVEKICLAMKKRGFGVGRWNGVGGKMDEGESIIDCAKRETKEEIGIDIKKIKKVAELSFYFSHKPEWNQKVHTYFTEEWAGEPVESEEMKPQWFSPDDLPFDSMWPDDPFWLPKVMAGNTVKAQFVFGEGDVVLEKEVNIVEKF